MELGQTVLCNLDNLYESLYDALSQVPSYIQYMELGQTVVLYNLENLYESLYDALNQVPSYCIWSWVRLLSSTTWTISMRASTTPLARYPHTVQCTPLVLARSAVNGRE